MTNQQKIAQAKEKIKELKSLIESLEKEEEGGVWVPEEGDEYWVVENAGVITWHSWDNDEIDQDYLSVGNVFKTEEEAQMHKLRLQSMAQRGKMPKQGEEIWCWEFILGRPTSWTFSGRFVADYWIGNVKKTKEECEAWYEKFGKAWEEDK